MEKKSIYLDERLISYSDAGIYPFHMPGHKRQPSGFIDPYRMDITEIDGFDNLHHAEGILQEAQQRAAELYGARRSFYLVNGSTRGILAAICAAAGRGGRILMARNCHKAVYHALIISGAEADDIYPIITRSDLQGQITPRQVQDALGSGKEYQAVVITSPTYEGVISDVAGIAAVCHAKGIPLIVDSAHGAHLGLGCGGAASSARSEERKDRGAAEDDPAGEKITSKSAAECGGKSGSRSAEACGTKSGRAAGNAGGWGGFPAHAVSAGADAVIMSLHKTLPSPTQTALLHLNSDRIAESRIRQYLSVFETSSPSYLLMAGMDACIRMLAEEGEERFARYRERLRSFYRSVGDLRRLHVMRAEDFPREEAFAWDDSKILVFSEESGAQLSRMLLKRYRLQMEMASGRYVLGMTSMMDTEEGFARLSEALHEIDAGMCRRAEADAAGNARGRQDVTGNACGKQDAAGNARGKRDAAGNAHGGQDVTGNACGKQDAAGDARGKRDVTEGFVARMYAGSERRLPIRRASELPSAEVDFSEAEGKICAEFIALYPPGIPLIVPGEVISREFLERITLCVRMGLQMESRSDLSSRRITIVYC